MNTVKIMVNFDISQDIPGKAVRLYDVQGQSIGFGNVIIAKAAPTADLFQETTGYVTYLAEVDLDKLLVKQELKSDTEKKLEKDVEDSADPEEDIFVRKQYYQIKDAGGKVDLLTIQQLREDYRNFNKKQKERQMKDAENVNIPEPFDPFNTTVEEKSEPFLHVTDKAGVQEKVDQSLNEWHESIDKRAEQNNKKTEVISELSVKADKEVASLDDLFGSL